MKERFLTILVPVKDSDVTGSAYESVEALEAAVTPGPDNVNNIYLVTGVGYMRPWLNPSTERYEFHTVFDREFPYLGNPLEIFDFTYDATRMGSAPTISAQGVMWFAEEYEDGSERILDDLWTEECHVSFNGENLYIKRIPTSNKSNDDARYKYDIDFVSDRYVLESVYIYDTILPYVPASPISESAIFSFYGDVSELAKRVNASLVKSGLSSLVRKYVNYPDANIPVRYLTYEQWNQMGVDPGVLYSASVFPTDAELNDFLENVYNALSGNYSRYLSEYIYENTDGVYAMTGYKCILGKDKYGNAVTSEQKIVSFDKCYINEALHQVWDIFELQYYITRERDNSGNFTGNILIVIGDCEHDFADMNQAGTDYVRNSEGVPMTENPFDYGVDNELLSKEKANTTERIVTRATGIGSSDNIPWYYPNPTADGWLKPAYKRNGAVQNIEISYPTSEGSTDAEHNLYEKFLKNRIGFPMRYGNPVIQIDAVLGASEYANIDLPNFGFIIAYYLNVTGSNKKLHYKLNCLYSDLSSYNIVVTKDDVSYSGLNLTWNTESIVDIPAGVYRIELSVYPTNEIPKTTADYYYYSYVNPFYSDIYTQCFSRKKGLLLSFNGAPFQPYRWFWYSDPEDPEGSKESVIYPMPNQTFYVWHNNNETTERVDLYEYDDDGYLVTPIPQNINIDVKDFIKLYMSGFMNVIQADGWYRSGKPVLLADYGMEITDQTLTPTVLDTIEFQRVKYLTPQPNLMPELYVNTDGERRFYTANKYPKNYYAGLEVDTAAGEEIESTGTGPVIRRRIINNLYKKNENQNNHYVFENLYIEKKPHEYIGEYEDVKPSIEGHQLVMTIDGVSASRRIDVVEEFAYDLYDNDEVWEDNENGNISGEYKHPYFFAKLRPLGFNLFDMALQEDMVLSMTTGHCGACNFKIGVDENTKKNPVQLWEYDVHAGPDYTNRGPVVYAAGTLRRHVDTSQLHYNTNNTSDGYIYVDSQNYTPGFLTTIDLLSPATTTRFTRRTYTSEEILNGEVGSIKQEPKNHFEGDVMTSGKFIESQQDTTSNCVWVALFKDTDTYGTIMPSAKPDYGDGTFDSYIRPASAKDVHTSGSTIAEDDENADKFVLLNIRMPQSYIREAEHYLSRLIIADMYDNNYQKFSIGSGFSRIYLAQSPDIEGNLNENSVVYIKYNMKTYRQYVKHYSYKMTKDAVLPEITVDLNDELNVTKTKAERERRVEINRTDLNRRLINHTIVEQGSMMASRFISRGDNNIVGGDIISANASASMSDIGAAALSGQTRVSDVQNNMTRNFANRNVFSNFVSAVNTFNTSVSSHIRQIRLTVEDRLLNGYTSDLSCGFEVKVFDSTLRQDGNFFWLKSDGTKQSTSVCPTSATNGMTDVSWNNFSV